MREKKSFNQDYLGLNKPGLIPEIFAPGIINTHHHEHSGPTFSPSGDEVFWSRWRRPDKGLPQVIMYMVQKDGQWSQPEIASFSGQYSDGGPIFSYDGQKIFFYSVRPAVNSNPADNNLWFVERISNGWSKPQKLPSPINTERLQAGPSIARNNNLYFMSFKSGVEGEMAIVRSIFKNGHYQKPEELGSHFSSKYRDWLPCIAPDESFIIYSSNGPKAIGRYDLYISFQIDNNVWSNPINLGEEINTIGTERFPNLSLDGKYLFFVRNSEIFWVDAKIINLIKK